jgi:hypothetical protein
MRCAYLKNEPIHASASVDGLPSTGPGFGQPLEADRRVLYYIEETDAYYPE